MSREPFQKFSQQKIAALLSEREFEDVELINDIERIFLKKRGYVFKMPKPGTPVILLLSGGLDSIAIWFLLLKKYRLNVYPLTLSRKPWNFLNGQQRSLHYYSKIFKKQFPKLFHESFVVRHHAAYFYFSKLLGHLKKTNKLSPFFILEKIREKNRISMEVPGIMTQHALVGLHYSDYLFAVDGTRITDFFVGVMPGDGFAIRSQSLTSIRTTLLDICVASQNFSLQFSSPPIEKELGMFHGKGSFISWATKNNLDLSHTHTCTESSFMHCGRCNVCKGRKSAFFNEKIKDTTIYTGEIWKKILRKIRSYLTKDQKLL